MTERYTPNPELIRETPANRLREVADQFGDLAEGLVDQLRSAQAIGDIEARELRDLSRHLMAEYFNRGCDILNIDYRDRQRAIDEREDNNEAKSGA